MKTNMQLSSGDVLTLQETDYELCPDNVVYVRLLMAKLETETTFIVQHFDVFQKRDWNHAFDSIHDAVEHYGKVKEAVREFRRSIKTFISITQG